MNHHKYIEHEFSLSFKHRLFFTEDCLNSQDETLSQLLSPPASGKAKCLFFIDNGVHANHPKITNRIQQYINKYSHQLTLAGPIEIVESGEHLKNNPRHMEPILQSINDAKLCRQSYVIAIGGGALLDTIGFGAAMSHRGIRHIRIATTTLAQADSAIGVKNGINAFEKKNYLGTFACPWAVINDASFLPTLSDEDWISGFSEAVKVALLKDKDFYYALSKNAALIQSRNAEIAHRVISQSAYLHFDHIVAGGDPFELMTARPLDFGHWSAHKLEQMTNYELKHGHAVAIGLALDLTYANKKGWLNNAPYQDIISCLKNLGFNLYHPAMCRTNELFNGLQEFQEHLGGNLTISMINDIGNSFDVHEIDLAIMEQSIKALKLLADHKVE